jgi:hypothetical protein
MEHPVIKVDVVRRSGWRRSRALYASFVRWLSSPSAPWQVALLALVMSLPAVAVGLVADDYELALAVTRDPWSAYTFYDDRQDVQDARASGMAPWWIDPELRQRFP